jgi:cytochrome c
MGLHRSSPAWPARLVAVCAALFLLVLVLAAAAPRVHAQEPEFSVLVFSKTTGFRHSDAIAAGQSGIMQMGADNDFDVSLTEDSTQFTDENLRNFDVIVFLQTDGEGILNAAQRTAVERWMSRGGGIVGIHADANADRDWDWKGDMMGGAWFANHPSGSLQFQDATVVNEDASHPSMDAAGATWMRNDEWYNFTAEPRGKVHVLASLDENSYEEQDGSAAADDHPIAWCSNYDGGRHFYTALGHFGAAWQESLYQAHILGAIKWTAGVAEGDCGEERQGLPTDAAFDKVTLDDNTENPMEIAIAPDLKVYVVELAGRVKEYNPQTKTVRSIGTIPVHRGNENGLLGIALDPGFATNRYLYLFYSAPSPEIQRISRFTLAADGTIDMASEKRILEFPHQRIICCHSSGSMTFGPTGDLFISTGDDTQHAESQGYNPIDDRPRTNVPGNPDADANHAYDARRTSGNTNDLRGKILRIRPLATPGDTPGVNSTYTVPAGNLFDEAADLGNQTRPEIYTMGHRNPFRISVDQETGWVYNGEVGPDANGENVDRGPRGYDEINQIRSAGNYGWPYCIADNKAYTDWQFPSGPSGGSFDCAGGPTNDSAWNTGLSKVPPAKPALLWWPYSPYPAGFPWGSAPTAIPTGSGRTAIAGPTYHFDPSLGSEVKFPEYYDKKVFFADWSRDWIATMTLDAAGAVTEIERFMPGGDWRHPQDIEMGPDGALYVLEWGRDFNYAGSGINPDSGLYRIEYAKGNRSPVAEATADKDSGPVGLTVQFDGEASEDPDGDDLTYAWDFDGDGTDDSSAINPSHTYTEAGTFTARLLVTDPTGKTGTSTVVITVGNTRPTVELEIPPQGGLYDWGDDIQFEVNVSDPEDGTVDCDDVEIAPGIFHDEGGNAHVHPGVFMNGCSGTYEVPPDSGHEKSANIAVVLTASYTDQGSGAVDPLTGADTVRLSPKQQQAEHFTAMSGVQINDRPAAEGGRRVGGTNAGDWIRFEPISLKGIDSVTLRYTSGGAGGVVQFRLDAVDGPVVGTATLPNSGGWDTYAEVTAPIAPTDDGPHQLYLVFTGLSGGGTADLFDLDELTYGGKGVAVDAAPSASASADKTTGPAPLTVQFTGQGSDPDGTAVTYAWDFDGDGTTDATTASATHTYQTVGKRTATFTVTDESGRSRTSSISIDAYAPVVGCAGDDEFEGNALDTTRWSTVVRRDDEFLSVGDGSLHIVGQKQDIHGGETGLENIVLQDLPAAGPWTATARVNWNPTINYQNAGFMIYLDDANLIKTGMVYSGGRRFEAFKELNNNATNVGNGPVLAASFPSTFYIRLVSSDGNSVQPQYSADGITWTNTGTGTTMTGLAGAKIGMYATASTQSASVPITASFDWFKLTAPATPSDEFDGDGLNLCRWNAIVRHDPSGLEVADGKLTLPAAHGDFFGNGSNTNPNILLQTAPSGPWTMETRMTFTPNENYEQAGLLVYNDDTNYVKADLVWSGGRAVEFLRETNNTAAGFDGSVTLPGDFPPTIDLRITSDGTTLRAYYRPAGDGPWSPFGEPTPLSTVSNPKVGPYANDSNATVATRDDAVFEYFRLTPGLPDGTAPTTTHALAPASPDGAQQWYRSPVQVTLSTEAGATTEYRIGGGSFQAYTGPFTLDDDGTHTVEYRSRDAAGNQEEAKTFSVKVDVTPASSSATLAPAAPGAGGTYDGPVTVTVTGTDAAGGSGLGGLEYRVDGGAWTAYAQPVRVSADGAHTVEHRATDVAGNTGTAGSVAFTIDTDDPGDPGAPTVEAFADPSSGPSPLLVELSASGIDPDGGALSYAWAFDDGTAFGQTVTRTFTGAGTHSATVTVTDAEGKTATDTVEIEVTGGSAAPPEIIEANADRTSGIAPHLVWFEAIAEDPDDAPGQLVYRWEFGDGEVAYGAEADHTYAEPGTYTATVTVTDPAGGSDSAEIDIEVAEPVGNRPPAVQAGAVPASGKAPLEVLLTAQASDPDGDALTYRWEFGDGSVANGRRARHTYTTVGTYQAEVTVSDGEASASATVQIVVGNPAGNQAPTVQAAADPAGGGTAPVRIGFTAAGLDPDGDQLSYAWSFGDGGTAGGPKVSHVFTTPGAHVVTVTVKDPSGASATGQVTVQVAAARAPSGALQVKAAFRSVGTPSLRAFSKRGLKATMACAAGSTGRATLVTSRKVARKLRLTSRRLASAAVRCGEGGKATVRLKAGRKVKRRIAKAGLRSVKATVKVSFAGQAALRQRVIMRAGR